MFRLKVKIFVQNWNFVAFGNRRSSDFSRSDFGHPLYVHIVPSLINNGVKLSGVNFINKFRHLKRQFLWRLNAKMFYFLFSISLTYFLHFTLKFSVTMLENWHYKCQNKGVLTHQKSDVLIAKKWCVKYQFGHFNRQNLFIKLTPGDL